jgi:hypothetical protein
VENAKKSGALSAKKSNEELVDPAARKLCLMTKKLLFAKTYFVVLLRELSLQKENF